MSAAIAECLPAVQSPPARKRYPPGPRQALNRLSPLTQALDLKDVAYRNATDPKTPVHIQAALMRAWVDLQEMAMAIRGQGKPKPVDAKNAVRKQKQASAAPIASTSTPKAA